MPKLTLTINGTAFETDLEKVAREDLYGSSTVKVTDLNGNPLQKVALPSEGDRYLVTGQIKHATKANDTFTLAPIKTINTHTGQPAVPIESSFKNPPNFVPATQDDVNTFQTEKVYALPNLTLPEDGVFKGTFNYRASYEPHDALLVKNNHGTFLLAGTAKTFSWVTLENNTELIATTETTEEENTTNEFNALF